MKRSIVAALLACNSCVALPQGKEDSEADCGVEGDSPEVDAELPNLPPCVAMSESLHSVYYDACGAWSDLPIASVCYSAPDLSMCWKFDSHQTYDGLYCCCDPSRYDTCDPFH